jgi:23S rRNA (adenine2503-C2)-methyltransferase
MLNGVNDSPAEARALLQLLKNIPAKINLIPFNPWPGTDFQCSDDRTINVFAKILNQAGYACPVRKPRGRDILAACGQLKSESEKLRASQRVRLDEAGAMAFSQGLPFAALASGLDYDETSIETLS